MGYSNVQIEGHIFDIDNRVMKSGKTLQMLYISDYDDAIVAKRFEGARCPIEEIDSVKKGMHVILTGEVVSLIKSGVTNVISAQPFGCLPNHIVAKGMVRKIKDEYPTANIVAIDYDPSASKVNQENRIRLMLANAKLSEEMKASV